MRSIAFSRAKAMMGTIGAILMASGGRWLQARQDIAALDPYRSRGKGEGCPGNKHAKSSFKQNKRRGL